MLEDLLTQEDAEAILAPHRAALFSFLREGWGDWHKVVAAAPMLATSRATSRANVVYDRVTERAETYFEGQGIHTTRARGFLAVSLGEGRLVLRFKKFQGKSLRTSGIPTAQRLEIERQQVALDGLVSTYVVVGYLPDDLGVDLDVLAVACTYNGSLVWQIDLRDDATAAVAPVRVTSPQGPIVRSTRPAAQQEQTEG